MQHQAVHVLDAPALFDELGRQPVDQLRMDRAPAVLAHVAGCLHQPFSEVVLPDPVHHDARRQRILRARQPTGQLLAPAPAPAFQIHRLGVPAGRHHKPGLHHFLLERGVASLEQEGGRRIADASQRLRGHVGHGLVAVGIVGVGKAGVLSPDQGELLADLLGHQLAGGKGHPPQVGHHPVLEVQRRHENPMRIGNFLDLFAQLVCPLLAFLEPILPFLGFAFPELGILLGEFVLGERHRLGQRFGHGGVKGFDAVVVLVGNGIVLVVVTAGASQGDSQKHRPGGIHHIRQEIAPLIARSLYLYLQVQEGGGNSPIFPVISEGVPRYLLLDESVVRLVLVERPDDVVPVAPHVGQGIVQPAPHRIAVTHHVHPVPGPALAVAGVGQQLFHGIGVGVGRVILEKGLHLLGCGRQPDQIEIEPPEQLAPVYGRRRLHALFFQLGQHEGIDRVLDPSLPTDLGNGRFFQRGPGPTGLCRRGRLLDRRHLQLVDPPRNRLDLLFRQGFPVQGHLGSLLAAQPLDERAGSALARNDSRTAQGSSFQQGGHGLQHQSTLVVLDGMAGKAVLLQEWLDGCFELMGGCVSSGRVSRRLARIIGPGRKLVDPAGDQVDLLRRQRIAADGHLGLALAPQVEQKRTLGALSRNNRRTVLFAALEKRLDRLHDQPALGGCALVTGDAVGLENGLNVSFEAGPLFLPMERDSHELSDNRNQNHQVAHSTPKPLVAASV